MLFFCFFCSLISIPSAALRETIERFAVFEPKKKDNSISVIWHDISSDECCISVRGLFIGIVANIE